MKTVGLFAYGETSYSALKSLISRFKVLWIITPSKDTNSELLSVESLAKKLGVKIIRTSAKKDILEIIAKKNPDAVVISSYSKILGSDILKSTKFINIHHGDLPRFRGRANINWALINGRKEIGLTFHEAISDLDAGDIYAQYIVPITDIDTVKTIYDKFNGVIEKHTAKIVERVIRGFKGKQQKDKATYCCTRIPNDGLIDWTKSSIEIYNLVRALTHPYPGAFTFFEGKRMTIWDCTISEKGKAYEGRIAGRVIALHKNKGVEILTSDSSIIVKSVSYNGKDTIASDIIKTVKVSLGIDFVYLYENINKLLKNQ